MKACTAVTIIIIVFSFSSCSKSEIGLDPEIRYSPYPVVSYRQICFKDYNDKGIYLLDNRYLYKYMLYFFDLEKNQWFPISDGKGLPTLSTFNAIDIKYCFSVNTDSIIGVSSDGALFVYSRSSGIWITNYKENNRFQEYFYHDVNYYNFYFNNRFDQHLYRINHEGGEFILEFAGENLEWQTKIKSRVSLLDNAYIINQYFKDPNDIYIITKKIPNESDPYNYSYSTKDTTFTILQWDIENGQCSAIKTFAYKFDFNNPNEGMMPPVYPYTLNPRMKFYNFDNELYIFDYSNFRASWDTHVNPFKLSDNNPETTYHYGCISKIVLENYQLPFKSDTIEFSSLINRENIEVLANIHYLKSEENWEVFKFNDSFYYFLNGFVFKYSPSDKKWISLPTLPFNQLNAK